MGPAARSGDGAAACVTEGASYPFWKPDGRVLGFFADGKLKRIDVAMESLQVLAEVPGARGGRGTGTT